MRHRWSATATILLAATCAAAPASAQERPPSLRPSRALFGSGFGDTSQGLVLNLSFGAGYDDLIRFETAGSSPAPAKNSLPGNRQFASGSASLNYHLNLARASAGFSAGARARYYDGRALIGAYTVTGRLAVPLGSRGSFSTSHRLGIRPYDTNAFFGEEFDDGSSPGSVFDPGQVASTGTYQDARSTADLGFRFTTRLSAQTGYSYYSNDAWVLTAGSGRYTAQSVRGGISLNLFEGVDLRLGYRHTESRRGVAATQTPFRGGTIDAGLNFNRALSLTRRATVSFSSGLAGVTNASLRTRYYLTGHANLSYEIGRSWGLNLGYYRTADFHQTFGQPVFRDSLGGALGGLVGRRLNVSTGFRVMRGEIGVAPGAPTYIAGTARAAVQTALTRDLALAVNYSWYRYRFDGSALLPPGLSLRRERQSVAVSLNARLPLLMRTRRPNAAR
jgi:hypothetical protein